MYICNVIKNNQNLIIVMKKILLSIAVLTISLLATSCKDNESLSKNEFENESEAIPQFESIENPNFFYEVDYTELSKEQDSL